MNGEEALAYARMRYQDPEGDIGRTKRQQQIVEAIIDQSTSFGSITKLNTLMDATGDNFDEHVVDGSIPTATIHQKNRFHQPD
ncbi:LCP family protein [Exiguobacterium sp. SL14]|nr:LCP family protein [Exiguobacterium sp. SL14]MCY1690105.1 LCP family protein [Exiguobacterium sp. SL14]